MIIASGKYKIDGIKLILSVNNTHSLYPELENKLEEGYIDYENNIIYAFGRRLKKNNLPSQDRHSIKMGF